MALKRVRALVRSRLSLRWLAGSPRLYLAVVGVPGIDEGEDEGENPRSWHAPNLFKYQNQNLGRNPGQLLKGRAVQQVASPGVQRQLESLVSVFTIRTPSRGQCASLGFVPR